MHMSIKYLSNNQKESEGEFMKSKKNSENQRKLWNYVDNLAMDLKYFSKLTLQLSIRWLSSDFIPLTIYLRGTYQQRGTILCSNSFSVDRGFLTWCSKNDSRIQCSDEVQRMSTSFGCFSDLWRIDEQYMIILMIQCMGKESSFRWAIFTFFVENISSFWARR